MSQLVKIARVDVQGAPIFLGLDSDGQPMYTTDGSKAVEWLCDGWRYRFNQHRSQRQKYGANHELVPIGDSVDERSVKATRKDCLWLAAVPQIILDSTQRIEYKEWWAGIGRRKTLKKQGRNPGRMPRFKSRKRDDHTFTCWYNNGKNARFTQFNRHHGMVTITGQNPKEFREHGIRWTIRIHVRLSQPIRPYTSVHVNWTKKTLAFTNPPQPIQHAPTHKAVGVDRGVAHAAVQSDGVMIDLPSGKLAKIDKEISRRQRAMARKAKLSGKTYRQYVKDGPSKAYVREKAKVAALQSKRSRIVADCYHKYTTRLVRDCDTIAIEKLQVANMTRKAKARPNPEHPGQYLHNGQSSKRGLNRAMRRANLGLLGSMLKYKAQFSEGDTLVVEVNPAYTSQTCFQCKHVASENRESQAAFRCVNCGHEDNADHNAALNILEAGLQHIIGLDEAERGTRASDMAQALRASHAALTCKPQHS